MILSAWYKATKKLNFPHQKLTKPTLTTPNKRSPKKQTPTSNKGDKWVLLWRGGVWSIHRVWTFLHRVQPNRFLFPVHNYVGVILYVKSGSLYVYAFDMSCVTKILLWVCECVCLCVCAWCKTIKISWIVPTKTL